MVAAGALGLAYACDGGAGGGNTSTVGNGTTSGATSSSTGSNSCAPDTTSLATACETLCAEYEASACGHIEYFVPQLYHLYFFKGATSDCVSQCEKMDPACAKALAPVIQCVGMGTCDKASNAAPGGLWASPANCPSLTNNLWTCAKACLGFKDCDPATCNDSFAAGDVFCTWACNNNVCTQTCN